MAEKKEKKLGFLGGVKRFFKNIAKFFRDTFSEMKKVVWPSKKQILNNVMVVAIVVVVAAIVIFALDAFFGLLMNLLLTLGV